MGARFTEEDELLLRRLYPLYGPHWPEWDLVLPGHPLASISNKAQRMGLHVNPDLAAKHKHWAAIRAALDANPWGKRENKVLLEGLLALRRELGYTPEMIVAQAKRLLDGYHREGD